MGALLFLPVGAPPLTPTVSLCVVLCLLAAGLLARGFSLRRRLAREARARAEAQAALARGEATLAEARAALAEKEAGLMQTRAALLQSRDDAVRAKSREALFRGLVEVADDVIFRTGSDGRFTYVNPAVQDVLGYEPSDLLGRRFLDVVRADYREQARRYYEDQRQQGIPNTYCEFPMIT